MLFKVLHTYVFNIDTKQATIFKKGPYVIEGRDLWKPWLGSPATWASEVRHTTLACMQGARVGKVIKITGIEQGFVEFFLMNN